ncbi:hypothetical protein [Stenotrophomonas sp.]|uniref:hypothetical protein n=1 Tax=Stenotrophomonas sp. TaxID=69392 RepID=UPI0028A09389|nr:hypothetical protein [Stenotrophomonas sp.]
MAISVRLLGVRGGVLCCFCFAASALLLLLCCFCSCAVIPAEAGFSTDECRVIALRSSPLRFTFAVEVKGQSDSRLRGNDDLKVGRE